MFVLVTRWLLLCERKLKSSTNVLVGKFTFGNDNRYVGLPKVLTNYESKPTKSHIFVADKLCLSCYRMKIHLDQKWLCSEVGR